MSEISDVRHLLDHFGRLREVDHIDLPAASATKNFVSDHIPDVHLW